MQKDKIMHFAAGALIAFFVAVFAIAAKADVPAAIYAGFMAAASAASAKEFADRQHGGRFDFADLAATMAGGIVGSQAGWFALLV